MRTVTAVTVARSDYGISLPILRAIQADSALELRLIASGMHLSPAFGMTVDAIAADGLSVAQSIDMLIASDSPTAIAKSVGLGIIGFAQAFADRRPDLLLLVGDRFEMYAAAVAALPFKIPVAHVHGGEVTHGAFDDALRHSLTKLSHLHFVSTPEYGQRVAQLGESPDRIIVSGAPSLDNLRSVPVAPRDELETLAAMPLDRPFLLVTYHPVTLQYERTEHQCREMLAALKESGVPTVFTLANADTCGRLINRLIDEHVAATPSARTIPNLGTRAYFGMMRLAAAMVGNSSSGIIEAPSFELPVVNIGDRQRGRVRSDNVIDTGYERTEIAIGIQRALDPAFRRRLRGSSNPYDAGGAAEKIVHILRDVPLDEALVLKRFHDAPEGVVL